MIRTTIIGKSIISIGVLTRKNIGYTLITFDLLSSCFWNVSVIFIWYNNGLNFQLLPSIIHVTFNTIHGSVFQKSQLNISGEWFLKANFWILLLTFVEIQKNHHIHKNVPFDVLRLVELLFHIPLKMQMKKLYLSMHSAVNKWFLEPHFKVS